jgi:hypothetical protein
MTYNAKQTSLFYLNISVLVAFFFLFVLVGTLLTGCTTQGNDLKAEVKTTQAAPAPESRIKRGEYLVTVGGCNDCHTPFKMGPNGPEPDMSRMLSGHPQEIKIESQPTLKMPWGVASAMTNTAHSGPWGISFTMNLTPDSVTGIGTWSEDMFIKTIRSGKHWGTSRPIMPPMPWFNYAKMTDEDLKSVYAYLRSIPKVRNQVPDYIPPAVAAN